MWLLPRQTRLGLNLFDDVFDEPFFTKFDRTLNMLTDIKEVDDKYVVDIELPGYAKEDIKVELRDGYLTVNAKKDEKKEEKDEKGNFIRRERSTGTCQRSFYVGDEIKEEDIKASHKDGILNLTIPKKEPAKIEEKEEKKYIAIE